MQQRFEIADPSQVSYARRGIGELAQRAPFGETALGRLAIVTTECATNLLKHAQRGELLARTLDETLPPGARRPARHGVELLAIDSGPGIHDLHACFVDGYTTAGSPGNGMGAIRRLADELDVWSAPGLGTLMRMVVWAEGANVADERAPVEYGAINLPLHGELLCGDAWSCGYADGEFTVMVADGLGHGALANSAAIAAVDAFAQIGEASLEQIVNASHEALRPTRGAALGVARVPVRRADGAAVAASAAAIAGAIADASPAAVPVTTPMTTSMPTPMTTPSMNPTAPAARFCGIGNVAASVWTPRGHRHLVSHAGIVGHQMHKAQTFQVDWPDDALLILHSDGLATRWDLSRYPGLTLRHPALIAAALYRDFARGRDDITVFVARVRGAEPRS